MPADRAGPPHVLIVGAGFVGFHCARELERRLRPGEARVTLASPTDYLLYSPLLPHVAAGALAPADVAVPLRRTLRRTLRAPCAIVGVDVQTGVCLARTVLGEDHVVRWDYLVLCPGSVTRTLTIPGLERHGRGLKTLAEATWLHDHVLAELEAGNAIAADASRRAAHCTFVVVGAGYAGAETAATLHAFTRHALPRFLHLRPGHLRWLLVDIADRVLPELGPRLGSTALRMLRELGVEVRLGTGLRHVDAERVTLSDGDALPCRTLVWTAGVTAHPLVGTLHLPTGPGGRLIVGADLRVPGHPTVFAAGDAAAVPDLTGPAGTVTPPTAQHAQRQGTALARNLVRAMRGQPLVPYRHRDLGLVVDLSGAHAVARPLGRDLTGLPAQVVTRGYHLSAVPSWRARGKTATGWLLHAGLGDDFTRLGLPAGGTLAEFGDPARVEYLSAAQTRAAAAKFPPLPVSFGEP